MKKENYLDKIPSISADVEWQNNYGEVVLMMENKGAFNRLFQKVFKKPKISHIHLDKIGSFVWTKIDGKSTINEIATKVKSEFGENSYPLYPRLIKYFNLLNEYKFVFLK